MAKQGDPKYWSDEELVTEFRNAVLKNERSFRTLAMTNGFTLRAREVEKELRDRLRSRPPQGGSAGKFPRTNE